MTVLEVILILALLFTVPGVVWLAVDTWALRRDVNIIDAVHADVAYVEVPDHERRLINHDSRILALEDAHDTTSDLDVPHVDTTHRQETPDA